MATTIVLIQVLEMYNMLVLITAELDTIKLTLTKCKLQMYSLVVCHWYESILIMLQKKTIFTKGKRQGHNEKWSVSQEKFHPQFNFFNLQSLSHFCIFRPISAKERSPFGITWQSRCNWDWGGFAIENLDKIMKLSSKGFNNRQSPALGTSNDFQKKKKNQSRSIFFFGNVSLGWVSSFLDKNQG